MFVFDAELELPEPENEETVSWDAADEADSRYDALVDNSLFDPQTHTEWMMHFRLTHPAKPTMPDMDTQPDNLEPESERARRRAPIYSERKVA